MLLSGETIDYGPCAFVDTFKADAMFSAIDSQGRYRLSNQPGIAHWNTSVLASCLLKVLNSSEDRAVAYAQSVIDEFPRWYTDAFKIRIAAKLGLDSFRPEDTELHDGFLRVLRRGSARPVTGLPLADSPSATRQRSHTHRRPVYPQ